MSVLTEAKYDADIDPTLFEPAPGTHEADILLSHTLLEVPLLTGTRRIYDEVYQGHRGWKLCGPTLIQLINFDHALTGVPIRVTKDHDYEDKRTEHMDLIVRVQTPRGDNTIMRYFTGARDELWIFDAVGQLLSGKWARPEGAILSDIEDVTKLGRSDLEKDLGLLPYTYETAKAYHFDILGDDGTTEPQEYTDFIAIMNSPLVFHDEVNMSSGRTINVSKFWGTTLRRAAGATIRNAEQMLIEQPYMKLPSGMDSDEFIQRLKTVPHIMPRQTGRIKVFP